MIDTIRYGLALMLLVTLPSAVLFWYLIHPLTDFWKRIGMTWTYVTMAVLGIGLAVALWQVREPMTAIRYPFRWPLAVAGLALYGLAAAIEVACRKHLKTRILVGAPQLGGDPTPLLTEGIYAKTRNPRYLGLIIAVFGLALIAQYASVYLLAILFVPALYLVILLEEHELERRFGLEYREYLKTVPRLWPRLAPRAPDTA